jgi:ribosomal protein L21
VLGEFADRKVVSVKYARRKGYRRRKGHRQRYLRVKIGDIKA